MSGKRADAEEFVKRWRGKGNENQHTQLFWIDFLQSVLGVENAIPLLKFEVPVATEASSHSGYIDVLVPSAHVLIEQKSRGIDMSKSEVRQGREVTPAQQGLAYAQGMPLTQQPRYIVTCNFAELWVYDRNRDPLCKADPMFKLDLEDLPKNLAAVQFLKGAGEAPASISQAVSVEAGKVMAHLHELAAANFDDPDAPENHHALSVFMTRLMFLMFCEDAGLTEPNSFRDFVKHYQAPDLRRALKDLFVWLDTPDGERDPYVEERFKKLPFMNGGLFRERTEIPPLDETFRTVLVVDGCQELDWTGVSPTVFGSIFEGALSHDHRRANGQHFTSPENIHKVIDPLFLDELEDAFEEAKSRPAAGGARTKALRELRRKLGGISVLDPACGSGNFLTESYLSLRQLENRIILELKKDSQISWGFEGLEAEDEKVLVSLENFHGIELEDFACCVAKTALWIAEKQADADTAKVTDRVYDALPLKDYDCVVQGNALRMDWNEVLPAAQCSYVVGNPPFLGARFQSSEQKQEVLDVFGGARNAGNIDYCGAWYMKAARYTEGTHARCALVSTNSICQGEQVANLWKPIFDMGVRIDFAHNTFRWSSEAVDNAHVFCVIVGFSREGGRKRLFDHPTPDAPETLVYPGNINAYLADAPDVFVWNRSKPLCDVPEMGIGNKPIDGGNYLFKEEEREAFLKNEPGAQKFFRTWLGSQEFLHGKPRYCLWLGDATFGELKELPLCRQRIEAVREFRLASKSKPTQKLAETPTRFHVENMPEGNSILIPEVSSERRRYVPMGFVGPETFCSNLVRLIPDATLYHFGVLHSQMHNAWMRTVAGRLESRYRYSAGVVYNNFVWPEPTGEQRARIEQCAQAVLDARAAHPDATLADMYDPSNDFLFDDLVAAHRELDAAVEEAYGVSFACDEEKIVAHLFRLYAEKASEQS